MKYSAFSADHVWVHTLSEIIERGSPVVPRGQPTLEVVGHRVVMNMSDPVVTIAARRMGYRFMCASAAWILSGDNRVETIAPFSKTVQNFSDDGVTFFGAYGPKIRGQLDYVISNLRNDQQSRQAVINIWRENPPKVKDVPCTISHQFLIREGELDVVTTMRSNDIWLGFVYDVFDVAMLAGYVMLELGDHTLRLGRLYHQAGSRHLYDRDRDGADRCLNDPTGQYYQPFDPWQFRKGQDLIDHLWQLARNEPPRYRFLTDLIHG